MNWMKIFEDKTAWLKGKKNSAASRRVAACITGGEIALLAADMGKEGICISGAERFSFHPEDASAVERLKQFWALHKSSDQKLRLAISGNGVIVRFIQFPKMSTSELESAVTYEAEKYIPFKVSEVVLDYNVISESKGKTPADFTSVMLVAARKADMMPVLNLTQQASIPVECVDVSAISYLNAIEFFYPDMMPVFFAVIDMHDEFTNLFVVRDARICFTRDIPYGVQDLSKRLQRKLGLTPEEAISRLKSEKLPDEQVLPEMTSVLSQIVGEIKQTLNYFEEQTQIFEPVNQILLHTHFPYEKILSDAIHSQLGFTMKNLDFTNSLIFSGSESDSLKQKVKCFPPSLLGLCVRG